MGSWQSYFRLNGRLTPLQYWRLQVRLALAMSAVVVVTSFATIAGGWLGAIPLLFAIPVVLAGLIAGLRRLHDRGKSVWWLVIFTFGPLALIAPSRLLERDASPGAVLGALVLALAAVVLAVWGWIEVGFLRQKGPNRYGPDPKAA